MTNLYWLDQIQPSERSLVGNDAFNLSQLLQRGYPVLTGFVVPAIAFWECIELLGKSEPMLADLPHSSFHVDVDNPRQLQLVAQQVRQAIITATLPRAQLSSLLAAAEVLQAPAIIFHPSLLLLSKSRQVNKLQVKSSNLSQPFGILESHICSNQPEALTESLKRVWAELFRARSLFYWQRNGIGLQQLNLTVVVQPIWDAIASGTIEVTPTEWNIQSTWGIGIAIAKGEVLPDFYQLQVGTGTVQAQVLGSKTRAYRLSNVSVTAAGQAFPPVEQEVLASLQQQEYRSRASSVQVYSLSEEQQKQYALEEKYLNQLIELCQQLATELEHSFTLEWALCQLPEHSEPQLYLTKFNPQLSATSSQVSMSTQPSPPKITPQLVRGFPAATGRVTAPAQVIRGENQNLEPMFPGRILVARSVAPDWLPWLRQAVGVVTEQGGMTSHAAIMARELGIPAVVGAVGVTKLIQTGEPLSIDGDRGEIQRRGAEDWSAEAATCLLPDPQFYSMPNRQYPITTQLLVNLSQPSSLGNIVTLPIDGVGLLRSELMMLNALENLHYSEWLRRGHKSDLVERLAQIIVQFASAFSPRPVLYRSMDWRSHEFQFLAGSDVPPEPEINPVLGLRGTRRYLSDPTYFDLELAALGQVYASGYTNVKLMLPFVRAVEEFSFCRRRVEQAGLFDNPYFQLWIMAEVPSILFLLPDYVKTGVQGISIGTNDLTQLLLAIDRDQEQLGSTLDGRHPAVMRALQQLIQMATVAGIPCSICGQAPAQYPELIDSLVEWGISSISVDVNYVEQTYTAIARAEQRLLLKAARQKIAQSNV